jgi:hypothetical protein
MLLLPPQLGSPIHRLKNVFGMVYLLVCMDVKFISYPVGGTRIEGV